MAKSPRDQDTSRPRQLTLTEQARRTQLVEVTIGLVAERGYAGTSLSRIAEGAGITKAAVLYHFPSKDAVVSAAHEHVLTALTGHVAEAVEAVPPEGGPAAYVRAMIGHLREHPRHTRMIVEAMTQGGGDGDYDPSLRWRPLASLLAAARQARGVTSELDLRTLAITIGGAVDAIVAERLADDGYDTGAAADLLVAMVDRTLFA
ncbi:TetR family transcriptional regulator [Actinoalloteichus sp. AHMU CJ021]|uniref:Transcriptional regulator, TetR family n=1 Tax=Actinoalloteichus caeruleus DSM 43889 TaxID=1120930 RepID=A0ABT1JGS1_ACTCY|nr:TetR/AcrR family transcriptional regulator [Actinoalloteichus caeruleus]AUS77507.1 TetR family transcriptional regulator [Actinoalloteichus sp. AHMU CJ021]MCP2331378.1 transcriptional regulator, TetR family [Actinoalloteichus caeruleus DSM 43889]